MTNPYQPRTVADLTTDPPPPHLIHNVCRDSGTILLFGKTGIGKTRLLWQLACGWAQGRETLGLRPARPLRITYVEADLYRADFEAVIKEMADQGVQVPEPDRLTWFSREDATPFFVDSIFGKALQAHNTAFQTDLTIYDAIPDLHLGDPIDTRTAYQILRALHVSANGRAYLGVMVQRKGGKDAADRDSENIDEMYGNQGWARQASTVWHMTNVPSLVWVKHRLCPQPQPIVLNMSHAGIFSIRSAQLQDLILREGKAGFTSVRELAERVQALPEYAAQTNPYKDRTLRSLITSMIQSDHLVVTPTP